MAVDDTDNKRNTKALKDKMGFSKKDYAMAEAQKIQEDIVERFE